MKDVLTKEQFDAAMTRYLESIKQLTDRYENPVDLLLRELSPDGRKSKGPRRSSYIAFDQGERPGAGANAEIRVPRDAIWIPRIIFYTITTSAAAATRVQTLEILTEGDNRLAALVGAPDIAPSQNLVPISWIHGWPQVHTTIAAPFVGTNPWPTMLPLLPGWRIRTNVQNIQAADQVSAISVMVQERRL